MTTVKTSNKLTVKFFPWFIWIIAGIFTVVILPILITTLLQSIPKTLTCEREKSTQINCQLKNPILPFKPIVVEGLQGAKFMSKAYNKNPNSSRISYEIQTILLLTKKEEVIFLSHQAYKHSHKLYPEADIHEVKALEKRSDHFYLYAQQ